MNSKTYMLGFICGLIIVAIIGIVLRISGKKKTGCEYDERQEAIRGTGFKYAYFTGMLVLIIGGIIEIMMGRSWCTMFTFSMIALWISICVFTTYCVIKDAYFTLRSKRKTLIIIFLAAGIINLCFGLDSAKQGEIIVNGMLSLSATNLLTGAACIYLGLMMIVRSIYERRQEIEE